MLLVTRSPSSTQGWAFSQASSSLPLHSLNICSGWNKFCSRLNECVNIRLLNFLLMGLPSFRKSKFFQICLQSKDIFSIHLLLLEMPLKDTYRTCENMKNIFSFGCLMLIIADWCWLMLSDTQIGFNQVSFWPIKKVSFCQSIHPKSLLSFFYICCRSVCLRIQTIPRLCSKDVRQIFANIWGRKTHRPRFGGGYFNPIEYNLI